ncbi:MAG: sigma-54-dependent Fis family transcriptional regulator [Porticoccaceae bacterium]
MRQMQHLGRTFLESENVFRKRVEAAWTQFVTKGECADSAGVRDVIHNSWRRCRNVGVEHTQHYPPLVAEGERLEALKQQNEELLLATQNTWTMLSDILVDSQSILSVAEPNGVLLDICGNPTIIARAATERAVPGYDWSERRGGTNAIGTAIALKQAVEVHSVEHFCESVKIWSCSAAPIIDALDGDLLGVIDVTTLSNAFSAHSIALAMTAAHQIEQTLHSRELTRSVQLLNWFSGIAPRWSHDGVILLDRKGRVIAVNERARQIFAEDDSEHLLERNHRLLPGAPAINFTDCVKALPPSVRPLALESYGRGSAWEGGVLIVQLLASPAMPVHPPIEPEFRIAAGGDAYAEIIGGSEQIRALKQRAARIARTAAPVLILGETGCGKELFARAIHRASGRGDGPFVAVNCGTLSRELAASQLLGYEGGAFTGAAPKGRAGKFEEACGGTLFLDEIGELPADVQVSLLRVLQDNVVVRLGGSREYRADVRVVAATNRELAADVADGRFRKDLYYRLKVMTLSIPPLRQRPSDIPGLSEVFVAEMASRYSMPAKAPSAELLQLLQMHSWPGNVRELRAVIESMVVLSDGQTLTPADLPEDFPLPATITGDLAAVVDAPALIMDTPVQIGVSAPEATTLGDLEREAIVAQLRHQGGNRSEVAKRLGISRSTLYRKIREYGIGEG